MVVKAEMSPFYGWYEKNGCHGLQLQDVGQSSNKRKLSEEDGMDSFGENEISIQDAFRGRRKFG